jgi:hypothetical protein
VETAQQSLGRIPVRVVDAVGINHILPLYEVFADTLDNIRSTAKALPAEASSKNEAAKTERPIIMQSYYIGVTPSLGAVADFCGLLAAGSDGVALAQRCTFTRLVQPADYIVFCDFAHFVLHAVWYGLTVFIVHNSLKLVKGIKYINPLFLL